MKRHLPLFKTRRVRAGRLAAMPLAILAFIFIALPARGQTARITPLTAAACEFMRAHKTLTSHGAVKCARLALVQFSYYGFDGQVHMDGEIVVLDAAADRIVRIFAELLERKFPLQGAKPLEEFDGDDDASMADNNTSAFNDRPISGGTSTSLHAYGLAIDINPVQNPFRQWRHGKLQIRPPAGENYLLRSASRLGMAEEIVDIFAENGFPIWGGDWSDPTDYQHFQVDRGLAVKLAHAAPAAAKALFEASVDNYNRCRQAGQTRRACDGHET